LYGGNFASDLQEQQIRDWAAAQQLGAGAIGIYNATEVVGVVQEMAKHKTYSDNPSLVAVKAINYVAEKQAKASKTPKAGRTGIVATFPIPVGALVRSTKDGFTGYVTGYSTQQSSVPYVRIYNEETGRTMIRSVNTVKALHV
jgi:hypothetical protein